MTAVRYDPSAVIIALTCLFVFPGETCGEQVATRATVRADGTLLVDDEPVFPVGIRTESLESLPTIAAAGFNLVLGSGEWEAEHYATAAANKLLVLGGHYVWATFATFRGDGGIDLRLEEVAALRNVQRSAYDQGKRLPHETLAAFDHLPGVIGWNTSEEPEAKLIENIEYAYEIFKAHNPSHLVTTLASGATDRWFHLFRNTSDVLIIDNYPFRGSARVKRSLLESYQFVKHATQVMGGEPVWLMPQLIPPSEWSRQPEDEISLSDMRLQHYAGLIGGAKGVIMYHWGALRTAYGADGRQRVSDDVFRQRWKIVTTMVEELHALGPVICDGRPTHELDIRWLKPGTQGPGPQMTLELDYYGTKYLLVMNPLDIAIEAMVFGISGGNRDGYTGRVLLGQSDLSLRSPEASDEYVDDPESVTITVGGRGAGVFVLERKALRAPH